MINIGNVRQLKKFEMERKDRMYLLLIMKNTILSFSFYLFDHTVFVNFETLEKKSQQKASKPVISNMPRWSYKSICRVVKCHALTLL